MSDQFDFEVRVGLIIMCMASAASALAVGGLLLYIAYSAGTIKRNASRRWSTDTHIHYYFLNMMISHLILSIGELLNIQWIVDARLYPGTVCTVQGFLIQVGDVGVALSTMAIAMHVLQVLVLQRKSPPKFALLVLAIIWLVTLFLVVVPPIVVQHNIYGTSDHWCFVDGSTTMQVGLVFIWLWVTGVVDVISYLFLALVITRLVLVDGRRFRWRRKQDSRIIPYGVGTSAESARAIQILSYPLLYIVQVLPHSVARFLQFSGHDVPFAVTAFTSTLFASCGLFNTILYAFTRPGLMPGRPSYVPQSVHVATARVAHNRFAQGYMVEDDSFVTETGPVQAP
ncbi:hypothetical protein F5J12DRAFT_929075 [Pisolithus orientalis]|uniref:uncharacterized protein n=1 Tax=Pisolithus orientalis TaxID=936130 RepID=UPI00222469CB|nr:uncharacterized protein F5J12DRAFT_929075 [Pisolithus orientalis]KAI5996823.1 hypothetical protein F5J12DRAFT_929075 [Pisolithus orientalis]